MTHHDDDRDLHAAFESLREEDRRGAPAPGPLFVSTSSRSGRRIPWALAAATVASVAIGGIAIHLSRSTAAPSLDEAIAMADEISAWAAPSDEIASLSGAGIEAGYPDLELNSLSLPEDAAEDAGDTR